MIEPIKKEDIITQEDAGIIMAKAMIEAYSEEIGKIKDKVFKEHGKKLECGDSEEKAYHAWVAQHIETGVIHGVFFDEEKAIKFQDGSVNIVSTKREIV